MAAPRLPHGFYIPGGRTNPTPEEITKEEILEVQGQTVGAVRRAKTAGFDGVELGAHMRYLYSSFLSPRTNWRTDEYGRSAENRARILVDTLRAIRADVVPDYPVGLRMSTNDHLPDGQGPTGFAEVAAIIEKEGLGYIALSDANYESMDNNVTSAPPCPRSRCSSAAPTTRNSVQKPSPPGSRTESCWPGKCWPIRDSRTRSSKDDRMRLCGATTTTHAFAD